MHSLMRESVMPLAPIMPPTMPPMTVPSPGTIDPRAAPAAADNPRNDKIHNKLCVEIPTVLETNAVSFVVRQKLQKLHF